MMKAYCCRSRMDVASSRQNVLDAISIVAKFEIYISLNQKTIQSQPTQPIVFDSHSSQLAEIYRFRLLVARNHY